MAGAGPESESRGDGAGGREGSEALDSSSALWKWQLKTAVSFSDADDETDASLASSERTFREANRERARKEALESALASGIDIDPNSLTLPEEESTLLDPTMASVLPQWSNTEVDRIRDAFTPHNFHTLSKVPWKIQHQALIQARREHIAANHSTVLQPAQYHKSLKRSGLFHEFEYVPSRFDLGNQLEHLDRQESKDEQESMSRQPFRFANQSRKLKHEDVFEDPEYTFPYMSEEYELAMEDKRRKAWLESRKILHGPFVPAGMVRPSVQGHVDAGTAGGGAVQVHPNVIRDAVRKIHSMLADEWPELRFSVRTESDDRIMVIFDEFQLQELGKVEWLHAFMNTFVRRSTLGTELNLSKDGLGWNIVEANTDGTASRLFGLCPPWHARRRVKAVLQPTPGNTTEDLAALVAKNASPIVAPSGEGGGRLVIAKKPTPVGRMRLDSDSSDGMRSVSAEKLETASTPAASAGGGRGTRSGSRAGTPGTRSSAASGARYFTSNS